MTCELNKRVLLALSQEFKQTAENMRLSSKINRGYVSYETNREAFIWEEAANRCEEKSKDNEVENG